MMNEKIELILYDQQLDNYQKAFHIINLVRNETYYLEDTYLKVRFNEDDFYLSSHPFLKSNSSDKHDDYNLEKIYRLIEQHNLVEEVIKAINRIILKTDRLIFIQRFLFKKNVHTIMKIHNICQSYYYQALECAVDDFLKNLT